MLEIGDVVRIKEDIQHDIGYAGQIGIVCTNYNEWPDKNNPKENWWTEYCVLAWDKRGNRFWECGVQEEQLDPQGYKIMPMLIELQHWMNSQHSMKSGMKLKPKKFGEHYDYWKIRKEKGIEKAKR